MSRKPHDVSIWDIADRRGKARTSKPWIVRWKVDGSQRSKAFANKPTAEDFRARLHIAAKDGERFSSTTGMPISWSHEDTPTVFEWAKTWVAGEASTWQVRTLTSAVEALARWIPLVVSAKASAAPAGLRQHIVAELTPGGSGTDKAAAAWLRRWSLPLDKVTKETLALAQQAIAIGDDGQALSPRTVSRWLNTASSCLKRAVELEIIERNPWPARPRGHSRRKAVKAGSATIDVATLPSPEDMKRVIGKMVSHQPGSERYAVMTAVGFFAGLRPSEIVDLHVDHLVLPEEGFGEIQVREANVGLEQPGEPKTGPRNVPIPPQLVEILRRWITSQRITGRLFRTASGARPNDSNWCRALNRACKLAGVRYVNPYATRHMCATFWLRSGLPIGEVARRMGHSVDVLLKHYAKVFEDDATRSNALIEKALKESGF